MDGFAGDTQSGGGQVSDAPGEGPRARDSLFLLARLQLVGKGDVHDVRVRNLSAGGLMAEFEGQVSIGDPLELEMRGVGRITGRIAWATEGRIGVALDRDIDPMKVRKPVGTGPKQMGTFNRANGL